MKFFFGIIVLLICTSSYSQEKCLNYKVTENMYTETFTDYLFIPNLSADANSWHFFDYLRNNGIDLDKVGEAGISPQPLAVTSEGVLLLALDYIEGEDEKVACSVILVPMRKMCNKVGLEYYGKPVLIKELPVSTLKDEQVKEFCKITVPVS